MNGIHDMGGMHGMGPIRREENEPVFHERWEARVFALRRAAGALGKWNIDASRQQTERIPAADYLRMSYYEKWLTSTLALLTASGVLTPAEIQSGEPAPGSAKGVAPLKAEDVPARVAKGSKASRDASVEPRFESSQRVRTRSINPTTHTRLPRYARGKVGTIDRDHGIFVFPDTNALFQGENPQHVYSVRFAARELWGSAARPEDSVYIDLWEDYLEPA